MILAKQIADSLIDYSKELHLLLADKHFLIRNLTIVHFKELGKSEIDQLLNDKSAKVRLQTLYCLKNQSDFEEIVKKYLADNSATIRHFSRFILKQAAENFADFYNQNLQKGNQIIGSINGLAEIGENNIQKQ